MNGETISSQQLKTELLALIQSSAPQTRLPTERALAERYNLSRSTVNKVVVELEKEGYVQRRVGRGTFVIPRDSRVHLTDDGCRKRGAIVVAFPDFYSYTLWRQLHRLEEEALRHNVQLVNVKIRPGSTLQSLLALIAGQENLLGCIITPSYDLTLARLDEFNSLGVPVLINGGDLSPAQLRLGNLYDLRGDYYLNGSLPMRYLLEHGHRDIGYIVNEPGGGKEFIEGIREVAAAWPLSPRRIHAGNSRHTRSWGSAMETGRANTADLLARHPEITAVIYETIAGALGGRRALEEAGLRCPEDVSIITSGEIGELIDFLTPPLTSVEDCNEFAAAALRLILDPEARPADKRLVFSHYRVHERASVKTIPPKPYN